MSAGSVSTDRRCQALRVCGTSEFERQQPSATSDRVCAARTLLTNISLFFNLEQSAAQGQLAILDEAVTAQLVVQFKFLGFVESTSSLLARGVLSRVMIDSATLAAGIVREVLRKNVFVQFQGSVLLAAIFIDLPPAQKEQAAFDAAVAAYKAALASGQTAEEAASRASAAYLDAQGSKDPEEVAPAVAAAATASGAADPLDSEFTLVVIGCVVALLLAGGMVAYIGVRIREVRYTFVPLKMDMDADKIATRYENPLYSQWGDGNNEQDQ